MNLSDKIMKVLVDNKLATVSTFDQNMAKPQSALIAFVENNNLELFFQTSNKTRKYHNLQVNPNVSFVIGFGWTNLQYEGTVKQINNGKEMENIKQLFAKKESPTTQYYLELPETAIFKVTPRWIRYNNYDDHPPEISELNF